MPTLKITISGEATELLIGTFPKKGADWILEYYEEFKPYTDIEEIWYGEGLIPNEFSNQKDWYYFDDIFHKYGHIFYDKNEIAWFIKGELVNRPKIKGVYLGENRIVYDDTIITYNITNIELPTLNADKLFVFHGVKNIVSVDHIIEMKEPFIEDNLIFNFIYCGDYGYMLTEILYEKSQMSRFYAGSNIDVKSGWHSLAINEAIESFKLIKSGKFLEVKFRKK